MTWERLAGLFTDYEKKHPQEEPLTGYAVISQESFSKQYSEFERTYCFTSRNKMFQSKMNGSSIFANCLDGKDLGVRLDSYLFDKGWKIEKCGIL